MQEDIEHRSVTLVIKGAKLTGNVLKKALLKLLAMQKNHATKKKNKKIAKSKEVPHGKQTVKQLARQNQGMSNLEVTDKNVKSFERVARKYGVDFAVKKARDSTIPTYYVFYKARDADALTAAFTEYTSKRDKKATRPSVLAELHRLKSKTKAKSPELAKGKDKGDLTR